MTVPAFVRRHAAAGSRSRSYSTLGQTPSSIDRIRSHHAGSRCAWARRRHRAAGTTRQRRSGCHRPAARALERRTSYPLRGTQVCCRHTPSAQEPNSIRPWGSQSRWTRVRDHPDRRPLRTCRLPTTAREVLDPLAIFAPALVISGEIHRTLRLQPHCYVHDASGRFEPLAVISSVCA